DKENRETVANADETWKKRTDKNYGESGTKAPVVKEGQKIEGPQVPKDRNQQEAKITVGTTEEAPIPIAHPLVKIP
ncbi:coagulase, partial [Staphylococcus aureus]